MSTNTQNSPGPLPASRRLIINADDFGYTMGVTRGIIQAHKNGVLTSTSSFVNMPASAESLQMAAEEAPFLGLGLHINLTVGQPVSTGVDSLTGADGLFASRKDFYKMAGSIDLMAAEREIRAQIELFSELAGKPPDHLDSHHHSTYFTESLTELMASIASELGVPIRRPIAGEFVTEKTTSTLFDIVESKSVAMPDHFIAGYYGERNVTLGDLLNILIDIQEGATELMCHPGYVDDELRKTSGYIEPRELELESLTHTSAREVLIAQQISTITFADL